jgi:hypothetical protein
MSINVASTVPLKNKNTENSTLKEMLEELLKVTD